MARPLNKEMAMTDGSALKLLGRVRGRPFKRVWSGDPLDRRVRCRNETTIAAAALLAGEAEMVDTFVRAIEISDFDRRLQVVEADCFDHSDAETGMNVAGPGGHCNL